MSQQRTTPFFLAALLLAMPLLSRAEAPVTTWRWDDGQTQGWFGQVDASSGALVVRNDPQGAAVQTAIGELDASLFSQTQYVSFDLSVQYFGPAASPAELFGGVSIVTPSPGLGWVNAGIDLSRITAFDQVVHYEIYLGDARAIADIEGTSYLSLSLWYNNSLGWIELVPAQYTLDNVQLSPVPETGAAAAAMTGIFTIALLWRKRRQ